MKNLTLYLIAVIGSACLLVNGQELANTETKRELPGWGTAIDPDHDCTFFVAEGALLISVPGSRPHDLAADIDTINAPRVLQPFRGRLHHSSEG
jgi:hypothetical protein